MRSYRTPCVSQHWPVDPLHRCTKAMLLQIFLNSTEINGITLGLTVPSQANVVKPTLCCVQPRAKISEGCQLSPEGPVTLHPAEICSVPGTQDGLGSSQVKNHLLHPLHSRVGWGQSELHSQPTLHAQLCISCLTHHRLSAATAFQATITVLYKMLMSK